jgi:hypothetical protein
MAVVNFSRQPRRNDPNAAQIVQKNAEDMARALALPGDIWYPPKVPRHDDPHAALVVQENLIDLAKFFAVFPIFFPYAPRRNDIHAPIIVQKNLEHLAKAI